MTANDDARARRKRHDDWVRAHADELSAIALPFHVFETWERWSDFLENGHLHWHEDPSAFSFDALSEEQRGRLHRFLEREHGEADPVPTLLGWLRVRATDGRRTLVVPTTPEDAIDWLASRGAPPWLVRHHELVVEAARVLVDRLPRDFEIELDVDHVLLAAALHDAGKIEHPDEMRAPGHAHEPAGERLLLRGGFPAHVARACVTHAVWSDPRARLEDRVVALADKLWKGKRDADLETALVDELATLARRPAWEVFAAFDEMCELVSAGAGDRLRRSNV